MYRKAVEMHEIEHWKAAPGGGDEGDGGCRDADGIEKGPHPPAGTEGMIRDEEDIDAAQVQGQIGRGPVPARDEPEMFPELVQQQEDRHRLAHPRPPVLPAPAIGPGQQHRRDRIQPQPAQMHRAEQGKALPCRDGIHRIEKMSHRVLSLPLLCSSRKA